MDFSHTAAVHLGEFLHYLCAFGVMHTALFGYCACYYVTHMKQIG